MLLWSWIGGPKRSLAPETEPFAELDALAEALADALLPMPEPEPEFAAVSEVIGLAEFIGLPEPPAPVLAEAFAEVEPATGLIHAVAPAFWLPPP